MITVTIVGGPRDGEEVEAESPGARVHIAVVSSPSVWLQLVHTEREETVEIGPSCHEVVLPVRLTRDGYRAYWSERRR